MIDFMEAVERIEKSATWSALRARCNRMLYRNSGNYESGWTTGDVDFY